MAAFRNNPLNLFNVVRRTIKLKSLIDTSDLVIICEKDEKVFTHVDLFCLYSSNLRSMWCTLVQSKGNITFLMPSFKRVTVEQVIRLMMMEWNEMDEWDSEVLNLLHTLGIHVGTFDVKEYTADNMDIKTEIEDDDMNASEYDDININTENVLEEGNRRAYWDMTIQKRISITMN